jgi:hypothetical protein
VQASELGEGRNSGRVDVSKRQRKRQKSSEEKRVVDPSRALLRRGYPVAQVVTVVRKPQAEPSQRL